MPRNNEVDGGAPVHKRVQSGNPHRRKGRAKLVQADHERLRGHKKNGRAVEIRLLSPMDDQQMVIRKVNEILDLLHSWEEDDRLVRVVSLNNALAIARGEMDGTTLEGLSWLTNLP